MGDREQMIQAVLNIARNSAQPETWSTIALYTMVGGIVGALAAALPGLVDLLSLRIR